MSAVYARPVIPILLSLISGLAFGFVLPGLAIWIWCPTLFLLALIVCRIVQGQGASVAPLGLCALAGYLAIQSWVAPNFSQNQVEVMHHQWQRSQYRKQGGQPHGYYRLADPVPNRAGRPHEHIAFEIES